MSAFVTDACSFAAVFILFETNALVNNWKLNDAYKKNLNFYQNIFNDMIVIVYSFSLI